MKPPATHQARKTDKAIAPYLPLISKSPLFRNVEPDVLEVMLGCIEARVKNYKKGQTIFASGRPSAKMGMVLEGAVRIERCDYWGNRDIIATFTKGQSFGEVYACSPGLPLDVDAVAVEASRVLVMDVGRVTTVCPHSCSFHTQLIRNLLSVISLRTYTLTRKIDHLSKRNTRAKLMSYLSDFAKRCGSLSFDIPFNRQELADYLSVERSAMCAELSRMKRDGLVDFHKNHFELKEGAEKGRSE